MAPSSMPLSPQSPQSPHSPQPRLSPGSLALPESPFSPSQRKRPSLFEHGLMAADDYSHTRSRSLSPERVADVASIAGIMRKSLRLKGFPAWSTLRGLSVASPQQCNFTLVMSPEYRLYRTSEESHNLIFSRAASIIEEIKQQMGPDAKETLVKVYTEFTAQQMANIIYGSNEIELAGLDHKDTFRICMQVFRGETVDAANITPRSAEYESHLQHLKNRRDEARRRKQRLARKKENASGVPRDSGFHEDSDSDDDEKIEMVEVIHSRREVIQHAQAFKYITDKALNGDEPLTEAMILEAHRILCQGIELKDIPGHVWAGRYRNTFVQVGQTHFCPPQDVPAEMQKLVNGFNEDIREREKDKEMDPFYLAADICQDFVTIHPFHDGNGRMCRMLANAYLIKYAGIVADLGEQKADRDDYLDIAAQGGDPDIEEIAKGKLARLIMEKSYKTLSRLRAALQSVRL